MSQPKHPLYWIYSGLILLLIPAIIVLMGLYEKSLSPQASLPSIPPKEAVLRSLAAFDSTASSLHLTEVYQAVPAPRSGVLSAYRVLTEDEALVYKLVVVRHDIACATCRDLLIGILTEPKEDRVAGVLTLESWELTDGPFEGHYEGWPSAIAIEALSPIYREKLQKREHYTSALSSSTKRWGIGLIGLKNAATWGS